MASISLDSSSAGSVRPAGQETENAVSTVALTAQEILKQYRLIPKPKVNKYNAADRNARLVLDPALVKESMKKNLAYAKCSQMNETKKFANKPDSSEVPTLSTEPIAKLGLWKVGVTYTKGYRRRMEDAHLIPKGEIDLLFQGKLIKGLLLGVFDGHSGKDCASALNLFLENEFVEEFAKISKLSNDLDTIIYNTLKKAIINMGRDFKECGATVTCVFIINMKMYVANLGDARTIYQPLNGQPVALTDDAKPDKERFVRRITERGGNVFNGRIRGDLACMGACGDQDIEVREGCVVPQRAQITEYDLELNAHVILACDGLWDVMTTQEVGDFVKDAASKMLSPDQISRGLVNRALELFSSDNITVMVFTGAKTS